MELLQAYHWPGNIRELQNVIERSVILAEGGTLHIDAGVLEIAGSRKTHAAGDVLRQNEKDSIEAALAETKGRIAGPRGAAARLRIPASTLESKIRALKIDKFKFRRGAGSSLRGAPSPALPREISRIREAETVGSCRLQVPPSAFSIR